MRIKWLTGDQVGRVDEVSHAFGEASIWTGSAERVPDVAAEAPAPAAPAAPAA